MATPFSNRCRILGDLWLNFKNDEEFADFIQYNDLGLPLAYFISEGFVSQYNEDAEEFINETWDFFTRALNLDYNAEYNSLEEIITLLEAR